MTEEKNQGQAKDEAPEVEPCQVQLNLWKSLVYRADSVQFVQRISAHLSHMCLLLTAFSTVLRCIPPNFSTQTSTGKMSRPFYTENRFIGESQLSSTCKLILPPLHTPADKVFVYGKRRGKNYNVLSVSFSCLCLPFTHRPYSCWTRTETHKAVPCGECLTCAIQLAGYFCLCEWAAVSLSKL